MTFTDDDHVIVIGKVIGIVGNDDLPSNEDVIELQEVLFTELQEFYSKYRME